MVVNVTSPNACALIKATPFSIFISHRPWTIAYFLILMGAQALCFGKQRFRLTLIYMCATLSFFTAMIAISAAGLVDFFEDSHQEFDFSHGLHFGVLGLTSSITGGLLGTKIPEKIGLFLLVGLDIWIVSTVVYMFLVSFTGKWHVIFIIAAVMTTSCTYISLFP